MVWGVTSALCGLPRNMHRQDSMRLSWWNTPVTIRRSLRISKHASFVARGSSFCQLLHGNAVRYLSLLPWTLTTNSLVLSSLSCLAARPVSCGSTLLSPSAMTITTFRTSGRSPWWILKTSCFVCFSAPEQIEMLVEPLFLSQWEFVGSGLESDSDWGNRTFVCQGARFFWNSTRCHQMLVNDKCHNKSIGRWEDHLCHTWDVGESPVKGHFVYRSLHVHSVEVRVQLEHSGRQIWKPAGESWQAMMG